MNAYHKLIDRFARTRVGASMFLVVFNPIDKRLIRWTNGALSTTIGTEFRDNAALLCCIGAKSGKRREIPLLVAPLDGQFVLIAAAGGQEKNPAWYFNLKANPNCSLLMRHRGEWERLVADPGLAPGAVEELLRYDGPVHLTGRTATVDAEVGGVAIEAGQGLITLLAAANRDPARFADPDRLDITRADNQHLTFSIGIHYCLGAALARLEGQEVFKALVQRFPTLELTEEPVHREHFVLRGYRAVQVAAAGGGI